MMMQALASFASSEAGKTYAGVCERYGIDPAAPFDDDDVVAFNFRLALAAVSSRDREEPRQVDDAKVVTDLDRQIEEMRRGG